ncbi:unnamed protein product [Malus baccata var. baccata]
MTNINRLPFTNEIKQTDPHREFTMPYFTPYKGDKDLDRHLKYHHGIMILYGNNNALMCKKNFHNSTRNLKGHWDTILNYVNRFKVEKAKIISYNEDIATTTFRNRLPTEHPLYRKLIMGEELTLVVSYALVEKHTLWNEAK